MSTPRGGLLPGQPLSLGAGVADGRLHLTVAIPLYTGV